MEICIFGFDHSYSRFLVGLMDIFQQAEALVKEQNPTATDMPVVKLASVDGKPILCKNNILLNAHCAVADIENTDIFIITSIHDVDAALAKHRFMLDELLRLNSQGTILISICTGAFLLAETGLLDGLEATTHWRAVDAFRQRYPKIRVNAKKLIINHGNLFCSAGAGSTTDLAYYLLEKYWGHAIAVKTAKYFLHDFRRYSQSAYAVFDTKTRHGDTRILKTQRWIESHLAEPMLIGDLAGIACMSHRTFERRFKKATGVSPINYIQMLRVESAKQQLETTDLSFNEIAYKLGYQNSGSLRRIFLNNVSLTPSEYRNKFGAYHHCS